MAGKTVCDRRMGVRMTIYEWAPTIPPVSRTNGRYHCSRAHGRASPHHSPVVRHSASPTTVRGELSKGAGGGTRKNNHPRKLSISGLVVAPMSHTAAVAYLAFSLDGKTFGSGFWDHTLRGWDAKTGDQIGRPLEGHIDWVSSPAFSPDDVTIASWSCNDTVRLWNAGCDN